MRRHGLSRSIHAADVRVFSSASDAPRARRPTDVVLLILAIAVTGAISLAAPGPGTLDRAVQGLVKALPGLFGWFWEIAYDLLVIWALFLTVLAIAGRKRTRMLMGGFAAPVLAYVLAAGAGAVAGTAVSDGLRGLTSSDPPAVYPAMRLALAVAIIVAASPHVSRPLRIVGRLVVGVGAVASIALGIALPTGIIAGFAAGVAAAAIVHLALGSPGGRLSLDQVGAALADLGVAATDVRYASLSPSGVALALASTPDGRSLLVKTYGRDAWDGQLITSVWSSIWNRGETPRFGGRSQQVEHEAFVTLMAERAGVAVLPVVSAGMADGRDAVLVVDTGHARPIAQLEPDQIDDRLLEAVWKMNARLFDQRITHGAMDGFRVAVLPDGSLALGDFSQASVAASDSGPLADRAQLLVSTALIVDRERAVRAAHDALGEEAMADILPFLQPAALDRATRRSVRSRDWDLDDLRTLVAETADVELPKLEPLRRVTVASIVAVVVIGLVAYAVISAIANVGLSTLIKEFEQADVGWLIVALVLVPVVGVAQAFATIGSCIRPVRFGPVVMLQYAIGFISLAVPSSAARVALEIRFFGKVGLSSAGAVTVGVIDSVCGFLVQITLIVVVLVTGLSTFDRSGEKAGSAPSFTGKWVVIGGAALAIIVVVALAIPRLRSYLKGKVVDVKADIGENLRVLRSPTKVLMIFGGNFLAQVLYSIVLGLCLRAFGYQLTMADLVLTYNAVSIFAGFMPVPGGMGVAEAGYTAVLVALGVPHAAALSTAMAFRMATYYLPPIWGGLSMKWLRTHEYV